MYIDRFRPIDPAIHGLFICSFVGMLSRARAVSGMKILVHLLVNLGRMTDFSRQTSAESFCTLCVI